MAIAAERPSRPRRRLRLALSLRAMMVLVLVAGSAIAWVVSRARLQRDAVAAIEAMGGIVFYDYQYSEGQTIAGGKPRGPAWMQRWLGVDYLHHVTQVIFMEEAKKKSLGVLTRLPRLESLWISRETFTDENLDLISTLVSLREFRAAFSNLDDDGIERLAKFPELRRLDLAYTPITDRAIDALARCPRLEDLELANAKLTPKGIARLADFPRLRQLRFGIISTGEALGALGKVRQLESLEMYFLPEVGLRRDAGQAAIIDCLTRLSRLRELTIDGLLGDEAVAAIGKLKTLEVLNLNGTFTDEALPHLQGLTRLKTFKLERQRKLTPAAVAALQAAMPWVTITR